MAELTKPEKLVALREDRQDNTPGSSAGTSTILDEKPFERNIGESGEDDDAGNSIETTSRVRNRHNRHSRSSGDSIDSGNLDVLAPLEQALTPNQATVGDYLAQAQLTQAKTGQSAATTGSRIASFEVDFTADDPDDPRNWPLYYRAWILFAVSFATWVVVLYSTSYTTSMPGMMAEFHISSEPVATLGVTMYLLGLAVGSLILAPLSEIYGRRPIYIGSLFFFFVLILPCALATGLPEILVVRFFG